MSVSIWTGQPTIDDLNLSNTNFRMLMSLLGQDKIETSDGLAGEILFEQLPTLLWRIDDALRLITAEPGLDAGRPAHVVLGSGPLLIECGQSTGYLEHRLSALRAIVTRALDNEFSVHYG